MKASVESAPLAAAGAIVAALAILGLAGPRAGSESAPPPPSADEVRHDGGLTETQVGRLLASEPLDLNAASAADLQLLPGIGPTLAARIVEDREEGGHFAGIDELVRVRGIGARTVERLRPLLEVPSDPGPATPR